MKPSPQKIFITHLIAFVILIIMDAFYLYDCIKNGFGDNGLLGLIMLTQIAITQFINLYFSFKELNSKQVI